MSDDASKPPVIKTFISGTEYEVTESARHQAAINMRLDPELRRKVEQVLMDQYGVMRGRAEFRRRYPEAFEELQGGDFVATET